MSDLHRLAIHNAHLLPAAPSGQPAGAPSRAAARPPHDSVVSPTGAPAKTGGSPGPSVTPAGSASTFVAFRSADLIRLDGEAEGDQRVRCDHYHERNRALRLLKLLQHSRGCYVFEAIWSEMSEGMQLPVVGEAPVVVKLSKASKKKGLLHEFNITLQAYEATTLENDAEYVIKPLMAGRVEIWRWDGDGYWESSRFHALVTPLHESLSRYLKRAIQSVGVTGLCFYKIDYALGRIHHNTRFRHGDVKVANIVVQQIYADGKISSGRDVMFIDFGETMEMNAGGFTQKGFSGTPGYMSQATLSMFAEVQFEEREEELLKAWGLGAITLELKRFFAQGDCGICPEDETFGIGISLVDALVAIKRAETGHQEPFELGGGTGYWELNSFFKSKPAKSWEELQAILHKISENYRRVWEGKVYEDFLGEEYREFFPVIQMLLKKPFFDHFESPKFRLQIRSDEDIWEEYVEALKRIRTQEIEDGFVMKTIAEVLAAESGPASTTARTTPKPSKRGTVFTHKKRAPANTAPTPSPAPSSSSPPTGSHPGPATASSPPSVDPTTAQSTATANTNDEEDLTPPADDGDGAVSSDAPKYGCISGEDVYMLTNGNFEPFKSKRVRATGITIGGLIRSWDSHGTVIRTMKGNFLVPQADGGYALEIWMRLDSDGVLWIDPDLGCGRKTFVCQVPGCGEGEKKFTFQTAGNDRFAL